jgi:hypothetical protein
MIEMFLKCQKGALLATVNQHQYWPDLGDLGFGDRQNRCPSARPKAQRFMRYLFSHHPSVFDEKTGNS